MFYSHIRPGPQPEEGQSGNAPPKFSQTYVFVRYSNKLHHFAPFPPQKTSVGCGPALDCGNTAECSVNMSVNTTAAHNCAFCETKSLGKNAKCGAYGLFCGTNSRNRRAEDQPEVGYFLKGFLPTPTTPHQTPSDYPGLVVVVVLVQNMLE